MSAVALAARWRDAAPRLTFWPAAEAGLALLILLLFSNALIAPLLADPADPEGSAVLRLLWPPVYFVTIMLIALKPAPVLRTAMRAWPLVLLGLMTMLSAAWSLDAEITLRRGLGVVMTMAAGLWLASRYSWADLVRLIALCLAILAFGSLIAGALFPGFGVMQTVHPGDWRGLWWEKNTLGAMMAWALLAFFSAAACTPSSAERRIWFALAPLAVLLVLLSGSRTALLAAMIAAGGPLMIAMARRSFGFAALSIFTGAMGVAALLTVLAIGPGVILEALGRDATLTGRTDIWIVLMRMVEAAPWTGYGYGAFWETEGGPVFWVRQETAWDVPTAHNAWLETALALGIPGVALGAWVYLSALTRALGRLFKGAGTWWALPFLAAWGVISLSESNLLEQNSFNWLLLSMTVAKLASWRR